MELIVFLSPTCRTGSTTISHYLANSLVQDNSKELVLIIEWTKFTGRSIFLNSNTSELNKQLSTVIFDKSSLNNHTMPSKFNKNVFYLCQNMFSHPLDMDKYLDTTIVDILKEVNSLGGFKYVILDLPTYVEPVKTAVLSNTFPFKINSLFTILDEDAISFKHMKDFTEFMNILNTPIHNTSYVINKTSEYYVDYLGQYKGTTLFPAINLMKIPFIDKMTDNCNRGTLYSFGNDKKFDELQDTISIMVDIVKDRRAGHNLVFNKEQVTSLLEQGYDIPEAKNIKKSDGNTEDIGIQNIDLEEVIEDVD